MPCALEPVLHDHHVKVSAEEPGYLKRRARVGCARGFGQLAQGGCKLEPDQVLSPRRASEERDDWPHAGPFRCWAISCCRCSFLDGGHADHAATWVDVSSRSAYARSR